LMIVERQGNRNVLVRHRDSDGERKETMLKGYYPFGYLLDEDAEHLPALSKESGYTGVYGESLTKVTMGNPADIGDLKNQFDKTWECNIPWTNRCLSLYNQSNSPIENYNHRIWYLDMEWSMDSERITVISVYDSYKEKMWTWAVVPPEDFNESPTTLDFLRFKEHPDWQNGSKSISEYKYSQAPIRLFQNEADMLWSFVKQMQKCDPDIITGWNVVNADCRVLIERCQANGIDPKKMCGGSSRTIRYNYSDWAQPIGGRLVIDLMLAVCNLWQLKNGALPNKKLDTVADLLLNDKKLPLSDGHNTYYSDFHTYLDYNIQDVALLPQLNEKVNAINHYLAIQHIVQCDIQTTPFVTRLFTVMAINDDKFNYCIPSKPQFQHEAYSGADIMEPEPGVYEGVAIMDIKAMYHSNVNLHNISWETLDDDGKDCGNGTSFSQSRLGLLGRQMDYMTVLRNDYKRLKAGAKSKAEEDRWDAMQYATKSLVASMYGAAGDSKYGLYHPKVAAAITFTSRQTLFRLRDECELRDMKVIYGHTDSVFVLCDSPELGKIHIASINDDMSPIITEFEKWCSSMLIVAKNRYAGMTKWTEGEYHDPKLYVKGIELKQNRLPAIMKRVMSETIEGLLTGISEGQMTTNLTSLITGVVKGEVDGKDLCINAKLSRNLEEYSVLGESRAGAAWANKHLGKGYRKGSNFLSTLSIDGSYIAFCDPKEIEGITTIGYKHLAERFIINKVRPYYHIACFDMQPLVNALNGVSDVSWL